MLSMTIVGSKACLRKILASLMAVDQGIQLGVTTKVWQLIAVPMTLVLLGRNLSPEQQGFYYTFSSLIALQTFFELGVSIVIVNVASHQWSMLSLHVGHISGDPGARSRLVSLATLALRWYFVVAGLFSAGVGTVGYIFLQRESTLIHWRMPWLAVVALYGATLVSLPLIALLEGCNQVVVINRARLWQTVFGGVALWMGLLAHAGLWVLVIPALSIVLRDAYLLFVRYGSFLRPLLWDRGGGQGLNWKTDIWPMQWRLGVMGLVNYLTYSLFTPVMFYFHGAVSAGRMGMTLAIINGVQSMAAVWIQVLTPQLGMLAASKQHGKMNAIWRRGFATSTAIVGLGCVAVWVGVGLISHIAPSFAERLLSPFPVFLFGCAAVCMQVIQWEATYCRAHCEERLLACSTVSSLTIGMCVLYFGHRFGPTGAAAAYLGVLMLVSVPWASAIWLKYRAKVSVDGGRVFGEEIQRESIRASRRFR